MKEQVWFETDLGYFATKKQIAKSEIIGDWYENKGRLTFHLKGFKDVTFQITAKGKLGITYAEIDYHDILRELQPLLVKADGTPAEINFKSKKEVPFGRKDIFDVEKTIEDLRFRLLREPTEREVAQKIGETPEETHKLVWRLIPKTGWKEPTKEQIKDANEKIREIYEIASLLEIRSSWDLDVNTILKRPVAHLRRESSEKILERANYALKYEHDKLPVIVDFPMQALFEKTEPVSSLKWFKFEWPKGSNMQTGFLEYYDKQNKILGGRLGASAIMGKTFLESLKRIKD